jgi:hypothetical protein
MKYLALLLAMNVSAAQLDLERQPPADWPVLGYEIYLVTPEELRKVCPLRPPIYGCAIPLFATGRCLVFLREYEEQLRNHELLHCSGYDHINETTMRDLWNNFKNWRMK